MQILVSTYLLLMSMTVTLASNCSMDGQTYAHEWNKAAFYRCSRNCPNLEGCPPYHYYHGSTGQCNRIPVEWLPRFDLNGRYTWPWTTNFIEIQQVNYDVKWKSDEPAAQYTFNGRYLNETTVSGLLIILVKRTNCIRIEQMDLNVLGKRNFCRSRVAIHWYSRTCNLALTPNHCHIYWFIRA